MRASFNVLDSAWIPVVCKNGDRKLLGVRQTLAQAHELKEISDPSPLEEYSLYRFLGLFLMDALRPEEEADLEDLYESGRFDMERIERYIFICESEGVSFDLLDENRPFLQAPCDEKTDGDVKPVSVLDCTAPSGNNHLHFNHIRPEKYTPDKAARLLLTVYWFCTAAAQGYPSGVYGAPPLFGVIKGNDLFESLTSLVFPLDSIGLPFDEPPVLWRRTEPIRPKAEIGNTSWLHGLLFPTRRICLVPDEDGNVIGVRLSQGENYVNKETWRDPYATYRSSETGIFPLRPHSDNPIWRNYCDIIDIPGDHASKMLTLYRTVRGDRDVNLTLYGVETSNASYLSVHRYDLKLPLKLSEQWAIDLLSKTIAVSQQMRKTLEKILRETPAVPEAVVSAASGRFDRDCEVSFWKMCDEMNDGDRDARKLFDGHCSFISESAIRTYDDLLKTINLRAHALAVSEEKRRWLYFEVKKLLRKEETT